MTTPTLKRIAVETIQTQHGLRDVITDVQAVSTYVEQLERERDGWKDTAARSQRDADYYRNLVVCCGNAIGEAAKTCDDGTKSEDVLCAKVPECVSQIIADRDAWKAKAERKCRIKQQTHRLGFGFYIHECGFESAIGDLQVFCKGCGGQIVKEGE